MQSVEHLTSKLTSITSARMRLLFDWIYSTLASIFANSPCAVFKSHDVKTTIYINHRNTFTRWRNMFLVVGEVSLDTLLKSKQEIVSSLYEETKRKEMKAIDFSS